MDICDNNLSEVAPVSLAKAVVAMRDVNMGSTQLTAQQGQQVMEAISRVEPDLRKLEVRFNS